MSFTTQQWSVSVSRSSPSLPEVSPLWLQPVPDDGQSLIFIKNISQSKIKELWEILMEKIQGVKNFVPLLDKVIKWWNSRDQWLDEDPPQTFTCAHVRSRCL